MSKNIKPLTNEQLKNIAPTLFTNEPHFDVSDKYHFIPTIVKEYYDTKNQ